MFNNMTFHWHYDKTVNCTLINSAACGEWQQAAPTHISGSLHWAVMRGLSGPWAGVYKANSCVIVSRAWENVPLAGRWRDLTPEPLVKKTCVLPDSIVMLMSTSTLLNLMLTFFLSFFWAFFFLLLSFFFFFWVTCLWENLLRSYSVKLINQAFAVKYNREALYSWNTHFYSVSGVYCVVLKFSSSNPFKESKTKKQGWYFQG